MSADNNRRDDIKARLDRPIVLIGMMGAGKSALGVRLAARLEMAFADADTAIEEAAQMRVAEIFEMHGEAAFRDGERRVIKRLLGDGPHVLALGGGAFMDPETRDLVRHKALSIWLDVPLAELVTRVKKKPEKRPLLIGQDVEATLADLLAARQSAYQQADMKVNVGGGGSHDDAVEKLLDALLVHLTANPQ